MAGEKTYSILEVRERLTKTLKDRVSLYEGEMLALRHRELKKSEAGSCLLCGNADLPGVCTCLSKAEIEKCGESMKPVAPVKVKKGECPKCGKGSVCKCMGKADVPMAAAPTKPGTAAAPKSTGGSPKIGAGAPKPPSSPMGKGELDADGKPVPVTAASAEKKKNGAVLPGDKAPKDLTPDDSGAGGGTDYKKGKSLKKSIVGERLAKAGPRLGGKDPLSQGMTSDAARAAQAPAPGAGAAPAPKLDANAQAQRHAQYADFTPAGAHQAAGGSAVAGAMKPAAPAAPPPMGVAHLKGPTGTAAQGGGLLARFHDALHGKKQAAPAAAPAMKNEFAKSLGGCVLCGGQEHPGVCAKT